MVSTSGAYGGTTGSNAGISGCDVVARFEANTTTAPTPATWTAYTGGDTTWTVEVTDDVVYAGGHQRWQNNPGAGDSEGPGAVSRPGIAALNTLNGMPYSWNPTRTRGVGVQDMLATPQGLWVGSDTDRIGDWEYHGRIALMPLAGGDELKQMVNTTLPAELYSVASGDSQLRRQTFDGSPPPAATSAPNGSVAWGSTTGAFMAHGVLYTASSNGSFTKRTFDGTNYGNVSEVNAADALVRQGEWHDVDVPNMTSLFYYNGRMYFTRGTQNTLFRRGFEPESDVVGQQRFSSGSVSGIPFASIRGAFVADNFFYYATATGLYRAPWGGNAPLPGTPTQISASSQFASRSMFAFQGDNAEPPPPPANVPPTASASVSCTLLECTFSSAGTKDTDGTFTLLWDFGGGDTTDEANPTRTYSASGPQTATLTVTDDDGETDTETLNFNVSDVASPVAFEGVAHTNGNRVSHAVTVPAGTEVGDAMLLFFSANTTSPTYSWPADWTPVGPSIGAGGIVGRAFTKVATASDLGAVVQVSSSAYAKSDMALAVYSGTDGTDPIGASAGFLDTAVTASHTSPAVTAPADGKWLVTYWSDKSSSTTSWTTDPPGQTRRSTRTGSSGGHMTGLLVDSAADVSGETGGLTATADATTDRAVSFSVVLR